MAREARQRRRSIESAMDERLPGMGVTGGFERMARRWREEGEGQIDVWMRRKNGKASTNQEYR